MTKLNLRPKCGSKTCFQNLSITRRENWVILSSIKNVICLFSPEFPTGWGSWRALSSPARPRTGSSQTPAKKHQTIMCNCCVIIISSSHHIIKSLYHQVIILESRHPDLFQLKQLIGGESRSDPFWFSERQQKLWKMWTCKDMLLSNIETMACCEKVQNIQCQHRKQFLKIKLLQMPSAVIVSSTVIFQTYPTKVFWNQEMWE